MSHIQKDLHFSLSVVSSTLTQDALVALDSTPTIYRYTLEGEYVSHTSIGGFSPLSYRYSKAITVSQDGEYALLCDTQNSKAILLSLQTKKVLLSIAMEKNPRFALISPDMTYLFVSNTVGRTAIYNLATLKLHDEFAFVDEIANAAFANDGSKIFVTSLDKTLYIYNLLTKKIEQKIKLDDVIEAISISSKGNQALLFARSGNTFSYNLGLNRSDRVDPTHEWPTTLAHSKNRHVIILGTRSSQLYFYSAGKGNILGSLSFDSWGITSLSASQTKLLVCFSDGSATLLDASEDIAQAKAALQSSNFEQLSLLVMESPLIFINQEFCEILEQNYTKLLDYKPVSLDERKGFDALVSLLLSNEDKASELYDELFKSSNIAPFFAILESGENINACSSAYSTPLLRQLKEFKELRTNCYKNIEQDIRLLQSDPQRFLETLESKQLVCRECKHGVEVYSDKIVEAYEKLQSSANAKNYATLLEITKEYPILRQTKIFRRMMHYGEALIDKTLMMLSVSKINEAMHYATKLTLIKPFAKTGNDFKAQITKFTQFQKVCASQNIEQIFSLIKENPAFRTTDIFKKQLMVYKEHANAALIIAKKGDIAEFLKHMDKYLRVEYFEAQNANLIKIALIYEIKTYAPPTQEEAYLKKYHECFGWDKHYEAVCNFFEVQCNKEIKVDGADTTCLEKTTFFDEKPEKRKDHFKAVGE